MQKISFWGELWQEAKSAHPIKEDQKIIPVCSSNALSEEPDYFYCCGKTFLTTE